MTEVLSQCHQPDVPDWPLEEIDWECAYRECGCTWVAEPAEIWFDRSERSWRGRAVCPECGEESVDEPVQFDRC